MAFRRGERKDLIAARHRARFEGDDGVVFVGVAKERCKSFKASKRSTPRGSVTFEYEDEDVRVQGRVPPPLAGELRAAGRAWERARRGRD